MVLLCTEKLGCDKATCGGFIRITIKCHKRSNYCKLGLLVDKFPYIVFEFYMHSRIDMYSSANLGWFRMKKMTTGCKEVIY